MNLLGEKFIIADVVYCLLVIDHRSVSDFLLVSIFLTQMVRQGDSFTPVLNYDFDHEFSSSSFLVIIFSSLLFLGVRKKIVTFF